MRISILIFIYTIRFNYLKVYTKFEEKKLAQLGAEKSVTEFPLERKKSEQIRRLISNMWLFFVTQYNSSLSSFVPNFRIIIGVVTEKSLTEKNFHMYYIRATEGKMKK